MADAELTMTSCQDPSIDSEEAKEIRSGPALRSPRMYEPSSFGALGIYLALSAFFFGRGLIGRFAASHIGAGPDPGLMMWFLVWWPTALLNAINPFISHALWVPAGFNLAWQTSIPFASIVASPLTLTAGPVVAFNVVSILSPALDAWAAFVLCYYLSRNWWAALLGGYVFGYSAFLLNALQFGHLHLALAFCVPLVAYAVARRLKGESSERSFFLLLTSLLFIQFLLSMEILATLTMILAAGLLVGWWLSPPGTRHQVSRLLRPIVYSYALTLLILSPYLYYIFVHFKTSSIFASSAFSADLLNFLIPSRVNEIGLIAPIQRLSSRLMGGWAPENDAYIGLPLLAIIVIYARQAYHTLARTLLYGLAIVCVLALGPVLHVAGFELPAALPGVLLARLPLLDDALPARFTLYAFLIVAVIASEWLATGKSTRMVKCSLAVAVIAFGLPNLSPLSWRSPVSTPGFFRTNIYRRYLRRGDTIIILPYGYNGDCMLWQAQTNMYFRMAEGYGAGAPDQFLTWPISEAFLFNRWFVPDAAEQLRAFLAAHKVSAIVVADSTFEPWRNLLATLDITPIRIGGVRLYQLPASLQEQSAPTLTEMSARFNLQRFAKLVNTARSYVASGKDLTSLSVLEAERLDLLSDRDLIGPRLGIRLGSPPMPHTITDPHRAYGVYLGEANDDRVAIGIFAWDPIKLVEKLRRVTEAIYFPDSTRMAPKNPSSLRGVKGWLVAEFSREQLEAAAQMFGGLGAQNGGIQAASFTNHRVSPERFRAQPPLRE